jgi:GTP diphosphokinase / guanosine-3',5'-bis(diphosphate) 3'-diphosphatase
VATAYSKVGLIIAALLHDTAEDTAVTREELSQRFGSRVAALVMEVTDDKSLPKDVRKRLQIEHAPQLSAGAQTIKLADKISNLRSIIISRPVDWDDERQRQYFIWAKRVVDALSAPHPSLLAEFERTYRQFDQQIRP